MSGEPGVVRFVAMGLVRMLSFDRSSTGSSADGEDAGKHQERTPAWPDDPHPGDRDQQERLRSCRC